MFKRARVTFQLALQTAGGTTTKRVMHTITPDQESAQKGERAIY